MLQGLALWVSMSGSLHGVPGLQCEAEAAACLHGHGLDDTMALMVRLSCTAA